MTDANPPTLPEPMIKACASRRKKLRRILQEKSLDAFLVSAEKDIQYLTGFVGHDSLLVITCDDDSAAGAVILSDSRYDEFLDPWRHSGGVEVVIGKRHWLQKSVLAICERSNATSLGLQAEHVTIAAREMFAHYLEGKRIDDTKGIVSGLRMKKDKVEVAAIEWAISVQQEAIDAALSQLTVGMSEMDFCAVLEFEMKTRGSSGASFPPIIAAGSNSSVIHYMTGKSPVNPGVLLIDWGATIDGYCSDMTRTISIGPMPPRIGEIYPIVLEAQQAAIQAIAPGKICAEIDAVARTIISKAGFGDFFGHGLGHGLGMDVHEGPYFNDMETKTKLEPGMVMTVEPGIYLPGVGGVRIEDDVLITETGARVLSDWPRDLDSNIIEPAASEVRQ